MGRKIVSGTIQMLLLSIAMLMHFSVPGVLASPEEVHDVSIEIYSISPWPSVRYGELVEIRCYIRNEGNVLETITANVYFEPPTTLIEAISDLPLDTGATYDWVVTWNTEMLTEGDLGESFDVIAWVLPVEGEKEEDLYDNGYAAVNAITVELFPEFWIKTCESTGVVKNEFFTTEDVYLKGEIWPFELNGQIPGQIKRAVYIFSDRTWDGSVYLPDETYAVEATVAIDIYWIGAFLRASIEPQRIWEKPPVGSYDVILDINNDEWYDPGIDLIDDTDVNGAGFLVFPGQKWVIVRGMNNRIYYNIWGSWSGWVDLPGATCDGPAAAVLGGKLHLVVRGMTGGLYHGHVDLSTEGFSGWTRISGDTPSPPALAASEGLSKLYLVVRGMNNRIYFRRWDAAEGWGGWVSLPGATPDGPAAAVSGKILHIVVRGMTGGLWHAVYDFFGYPPFLGWWRIPGDTPSRPELTASTNGVYLVVRGMDDRVYYKDWTPTTWQWGDWTDLPTGKTCDGPASAIFGNKLHFVVRGMTGGLWHGHLDLSTSAWSDWTPLTGDTPSPPELAAYG